jgi:hypothetical protein
VGSVKTLDAAGCGMRKHVNGFLLPLVRIFQGGNTDLLIKVNLTKLPVRERFSLNNRINYCSMETQAGLKRKVRYDQYEKINLAEIHGMVEAT